MSRNNRHQWRERTRPPEQVTAQQVAGAVPLDQVRAAREQQEAMIRARVENLSAAIYAQNIGAVINENGELDRTAASLLCQISLDAALVFAAEVWGIKGQRVSAPSQPPQPLQVVDDCEESCDEATVATVESDNTTNSD